MGYLKIADVEPHQHVEDIVKEIDVDKITKKHVCRFLNFKKQGYDMMDTLEANILESYFREYSPSAKGVLDVFFHDVANFLLEVACVSPRSDCMPKHRA